MYTDLTQPKIFFITLFTLALLFSCAPEKKSEHELEIEKFHKKRIERLKEKNNWLSLAGLFWLKDGVNTFGTDYANDIVFPENKAPKKIGRFILKDSVVTAFINEGATIFSDSISIKEKVMKSDITGTPTILNFGSLSWYLIKRGEKYGIRLKDSESKLLKEFEDIEMFPVDATFKVNADFQPYESPREIEIPTAIGTIEKSFSPGKLLFEINGTPLQLEPISSGDGLFLVFADETNGDETYGAGRFLYVDKPDSTGAVIIDFNKSYNPPCVFTKFATCPLPTKENFLQFRITAGEKNFSQGH